VKTAKHGRIAYAVLAHDVPVIIISYIIQCDCT